MKGSGRREIIIKLLNENKMVHTSHLMDLFQVSTETIRRDLMDLEREGLLQRTYGGAVIDNQRGLEVTFSNRETKNISEKQAIGKAVADIIGDGETIAINSGTTAMEIARNLVNKKQMVFITNCIYVALILKQNKDSRLFLVGGELRDLELSTSGHLSQDSLSYLRTDKAILGVGGIDIKDGVTDYHLEESYVTRSMHKYAKKTIIAADYSKFGICSMNLICESKDIDYLVTDWNTPKKDLAEYKKYDIQVITA